MGRFEIQTLGSLLQQIRTGELSKDFDGPRHNTMRFNVSLAYSWPMFEGGEMDKDALAADIRQAIIDVVNRHSGWHHEDVIRHACQAKPERSATEKWLHHESIVYAFD